MKVIKDRPVKDKRRVTVELNADETIIPVRIGGFYKLGGQVEDIVESHVLTETMQVHWCSIGQRWEP